MTKDYEYAYTNGGHLKRTNKMIYYEQPSHLNNTVMGINLKFLDKIVDCCNARNVRLVFLRSPMHTDFIYWQNEDQFQQIKKDRYSEIEFLDYGRIFNTDEYFADYQHLNQNGAEKFSKILAHDLDSIGALKVEN